MDWKNYSHCCTAVLLSSRLCGEVHDLLSNCRVHELPAAVVVRQHCQLACWLVFDRKMFRTQIQRIVYLLYCWRRLRPISRLFAHQNRAVLFQQTLELRPELLGLLLIAGGHVAHEGHQFGEAVAVLRGLCRQASKQAGRSAGRVINLTAALCLTGSAVWSFIHVPRVYPREYVWG